LVEVRSEWGSCVLRVTLGSRCSPWSNFCTDSLDRTSCLRCPYW
jgi:hypothetical protein